MTFRHISRALVLGAVTVGGALAQNDECVGALALAVGANPFDSSLATNSPELWPCTTGAGMDLWYTYAPAAVGNMVTITTCTSSFDTGLELLTGACGALTSVACNDDSCGLQSSVNFTAAAGTTYYVRVGGYNGASGLGVLNVTDVAPPPPPSIPVAIVDCLPGTFIDISGTGTALNIADDGSVAITTTIGNALLPAGSVQVGSNGGVRFAGTGTSLSFTNAVLPSTQFTSGQALFPFWDDFDTEGGLWGNIYWEEVGSTLIIQWANASFFNGSATTDRATFQIQVHATGPAFAQYLYTDIESLRASGGSSATIGYQNGPGLGLNDVQYAFNAHHVVRNGTVLSVVDKVATSVFMTDTVPGTWIDISGTGTPLGLGDDTEADIATTVGNPLLAAGTARVGSNGGIRFAGTNLDLGWTNSAIPNTSTSTSTGCFGGNQTLLPFWDDISPNLAGEVYWQEIGGKLIVQWNGTGFFGTTETCTFQVQVNSSGPIVAQYLYQDIMQPTAGGGASATIGYQAGGIGSDAQWSFNSAGAVADGTVLSICYADATVGTPYCIPVANSSGAPARMYGTGSASLAANDLVLNVSNLPLGSFGYFNRGTASANTLLAGGGMGTLCVGGTVSRGVGGAIVSSGATGTVSLLANLTALPPVTAPVSATVGQTLWLQYWFRDTFAGVATSNLSNALQVKVGM